MHMNTFKCRWNFFQIGSASLDFAAELSNLPKGKVVDFEPTLRVSLFVIVRIRHVLCSERESAGKLNWLKSLHEYIES